MHLEIAVRFRDEKYKEIGAGTVELRCEFEDTPRVLTQLSLAAEPLVGSMIDHAREEARTNLAEKEKKREDK